MTIIFLRKSDLAYHDDSHEIKFLFPLKNMKKMLFAAVGFTSRKHTYIILTPLNPTFI